MFLNVKIRQAKLGGLRLRVFSNGIHKLTYECLPLCLGIVRIARAATSVGKGKPEK